eukprot:Hpha_TRINITY_DN35956_c0_g1::TRINITY_DN35956_c0_g1_i1::g.184878::m.184878
MPAIGADILSGASAKKKLKGGDERSIIAIRQSVQIACPSRPAYTSANLGSAPVFKTRASVALAKEKEEERFPKHSKGKPFLRFSHRYFNMGIGVQDEQFLNAGFGDKGDWRSVPCRQAVDVSAFGKASRRSRIEFEEPEPDPTSHSQNRTRQKLVPETGVPEMSATLQWEGSAPERPRPVSMVGMMCRDRDVKRKQVFPDKMVEAPPPARTARAGGSVHARSEARREFHSKLWRGQSQCAAP